MFRALAVFKEYRYLDIDDPDVKTIEDAWEYAKGAEEFFDDDGDTDFEVYDIEEVVG